MSTYTLVTPITDLVLVEVNPAWCREVVTLLAGVAAAPGMVLAKMTAGAAASAAKAGGNTGNGALTLDATTPTLKGLAPGIYTVRCIAAAANGGTFRVEAPNGAVLGDVAVGATFADQVKFAIADGATDFVVGDGFDITVAAGSGKYVQLDPAGTGGAEVAAAIGYDAVDASLADKKGVVLARGAVVDVAGLIWPVGITDAQKAAALIELEARGIVTRTAL
jgi:hypothetical protein